jgi:AcrR family transcriptional regulator
MVQKSKKPPGRPRAFDVNQALDKAMNVFWRQGYDGTNLDELETAMEIARPSLYRAFGDKRALFLRCLSHYADTVAGSCLLALRSGSNLSEGLHAFFRQAAENVSSSHGIGCMIACVATSVDDPEVREFLKRSSAAVQHAVADRLRQGIADAELPPEFPVDQQARRAFDLMIALGFRGRSGEDRDTLLADAAQAAQTVLDR